MPLARSTIKQPFFALDIEEAFKVLESSKAGLGDGEVLERRGVFGFNSIETKRNLTRLKIILSQFASPMILVLIGAGAITLFLREWIDAMVIFAAVFVNAFLGFWQESKAENALELLRSYIRTRTRVKRNGNEVETDAAELVPGDVIRVAQGDRVPADARLIFTNSLEVDEAVLTGESLPVEKGLGPISSSTNLAERTSMIFSGTLVAQGFAEALVTATGNDTEFGKIATLVVGREREATPLQRSISGFAFWVGLFLIVLTLALFGLGLYSGYKVFDMFLVAVAVAVSAVPEGLPIAFTVILAVGVERLARRRGIVRRLLAAETLGSATLILTDKTGTLTQAKMELTSIVPYPENIGKAGEIKILEYSLFNTDVVIQNSNDPPPQWQISGKAVEAALVRGAARRGVYLPQIKQRLQVIDRLPFNSKNKFAATLGHFDGRVVLVLLGAPEIIAEYTAVSSEIKSRLLERVSVHASGGERVLGVAFKEYGIERGEILNLLKSKTLELAGLVMFKDPLRPDVSWFIHRIAQSGVRTVIVTGDHQGTAESVAKELGMIDGKGAVLTGEDLRHLSEDELASRAGEVSVYARVTPEQKVDLVRMYQKRGEVVAVTGDGVNDAPALQVADIGVAVGSGTDVAKSASDLIILDDNFGTIVAAIEEGRRVLDNIRKVIVYLLCDSLDELMLIGGSILFGIPIPINALQILFINFFSDSFPAIALAFEEGVDGLGSEPRRLGRNFFDQEVKMLILGIGALTSVLLFVLYFYLLRLGFPLDLVRTFIFASFATYTLFFAFSLRSLRKSLFSYNPFANVYLVTGVSVGIFLTTLAIYMPFSERVFGTVPLPAGWAAAVLAVGLLNIAAAEFGKWVLRKLSSQPR